MAILPVRLVAYVQRLAAARLVGAFALLLGVYVLIDAIESASAARLPLAAIAAAYPFKLPLVAAHVAPLACTLASLLAFGALKRRGEWDAGAAAGIGPAPMLAGLVAIPVVVAVAAIPLVHSLAPRSLARFEERTTSAAAGEAGAWWVREGRTLVRWIDAPNGPRRTIMIERGKDGRATAWREESVDGKARSWRRNGGWSEGGADANPPGSSGPVRAPLPSSYGFVGASLASSELRALVRDLDAQGQGTHPLRAELALRTAVAAGAAIVPILALVLAYAFGEARDIRLVGLGILAAAAYWVALAVAWNGAAQGALSPLWVSAGVPTLFAVFAAAVSLRIAAR